MYPAARSSPCVPIPRPSNSSDARNESVSRSSMGETMCRVLALAPAPAPVSAPAPAPAPGLIFCRELQPAAVTNKLANTTSSGQTRRLRIEADCMPTDAGEPTQVSSQLLVGVDVGGTFTDLVAF